MVDGLRFHAPRVERGRAGVVARVGVVADCRLTVRELPLAGRFARNVGGKHHAAAAPAAHAVHVLRASASRLLRRLALLLGVRTLRDLRVHRAHAAVGDAVHGAVAAAPAAATALIRRPHPSLHSLRAHHLLPLEHRRARLVLPFERVQPVQDVAHLAEPSRDAADVAGWRDGVFAAEHPLHSPLAAGVAAVGAVVDGALADARERVEESGIRGCGREAPPAASVARGRVGRVEALPPPDAREHESFGRLARRVSVARRGFRGVVLEILGGVQRGPARALASLALFATARGGGRKRRGSTACVKICPRVGHDPAPADHLARLRVVGVVVQRPSRVLRGIGREGPAAVARRSHLSALPRGTPRRAPTAHRESFAQR